jgi:hypothetical protein
VEAEKCSLSKVRVNISSDGFNTFSFSPVLLNNAINYVFHSCNELYQNGTAKYSKERRQFKMFLEANPLLVCVIDDCDFFEYFFQFGRAFSKQQPLRALRWFD